jgi:hypothetical protein
MLIHRLDTLFRDIHKGILLKVTLLKGMLHSMLLLLLGKKLVSLKDGMFMFLSISLLIF